MLFFILSGAELNFKLITLPVIGICGVYLLARSLGKYFGARFGCALEKTDPNIKKYLGLTNIEKTLPWLFIFLYVISIILPVIQWLSTIICTCKGG